MKLFTLPSLVVSAMVSLLPGCASNSYYDLHWSDVYQDNLTRAEAGEIDAMYRLIESRAQIEHGAFGRWSYVPPPWPNPAGQQKRYSWDSSPEEHLNWIRRAAAAGDDKMQRVLVLCHQFGCESCVTRSAMGKSEGICSADSPHAIARNPEQARQLASEYRSASKNPEHWDSIQALLEEMAALTPRAARRDVNATGRLAELAEQARLRAMPVPEPNLRLYEPSSSSASVSVSLRLLDERMYKEWLQTAAKLGHQPSLEKIDPTARRAGLQRRWAERAQAAAREERQQRSALLRASQAR